MARQTSASHSHANHASPALLNENRSCAGTEWVFRMYSPVRMCHPVSPSDSSTLQPLPAANTQSKIARNRQSDKDGRSHRGRLRTEAVPERTTGVDTAGTDIVGRPDHCGPPAKANIGGIAA